MVEPTLILMKHCLDSSYNLALNHVQQFKLVWILLHRTSVAAPPCIKRFPINEKAKLLLVAVPWPQVNILSLNLNITNITSFFGLLGQPIDFVPIHGFLLIQITSFYIDAYL